MRQQTFLSSALSILAVIALAPNSASPAADAVETVAKGRLTISTPRGSGELAIETDVGLTIPHPGILRAIVVFHGLHRDARGYFRDVDEARRDAGAGKNTLLVAPQFLNDDDAHAHKLGSNVLRWRRSQWEAGEPATGPAPISSFDVIDTILALLADRTRYPDLHEIVLAGHSGGGQIVQRYAVVGRAVGSLEKTGIALRYVVANPSSYVYFDDLRPVPAIARSCPGFNEWKYGFHDAPPYVGSPSLAELESSYASRRVTYLLGIDDDDPNSSDIDKTCAAEAQGPTRLRRGAAYFKYIRSRHASSFQQRIFLVPSVAHNAHKMFTSPCGIAALFDTSACFPAKID